MATRPEKERNHIRIFKNKYKNKPGHPDMVGLLIDENGVEFDIAMWKVNGNVTFYAGTIGNKEENKKKYKNKNNNQAEKPKEEDDLNFDDLPF